MLQLGVPAAEQALLPLLKSNRLSLQHALWSQTQKLLLRGPLAGLPDMVERERVVSPALIVIGEVTARDDIHVAACVEEFVR